MSPPRTGRAERAIQRLATVQASELIRSCDWYAWAYPREDKPGNEENHRRVVTRAAKRAGFVFVGRDGYARLWRRRTADDPPLPKPKRWDRPKNK